MPAFKRISINGPQFFNEIVKPSFGDLVPEASFMSGLLGEFTVIDDISDSRKIIDISPIGNILKRRDASCKITFDPVGKANTRRISVTDLYAATAICQHEFYQGCLKDWRNGDKTFVPKMFGFFRKAVRTDLVSNMYFGDTERADVAGVKWSHNRFDGIFTQYKRYVANNDIPAAQTFNVPDAVITPANSVTYLQSMIDKQDDLMELLEDSEKAFYIDKDWADAYEDYLIQTGANNSEAANYVQNGVKVRAYKGIPIFVNKFFKPILKQITNQANPHWGILTFRGNFVFGTDKDYGEGPNLDTALAVWYDWDELTWKYLNVLKAGTQIALPEHSVLALPA